MNHNPYSVPFSSTFRSPNSSSSATSEVPTPPLLQRNASNSSASLRSRVRSPFSGTTSPNHQHHHTVTHGVVVGSTSSGGGGGGEGLPSHRRGGGGTVMDQLEEQLLIPPPVPGNRSIGQPSLFDEDPPSMHSQPSHHEGRGGRGAAGGGGMDTQSFEIASALHRHHRLEQSPSLPQQDLSTAGTRHHVATNHHHHHHHHESSRATRSRSNEPQPSIAHHHPDHTLERTSPGPAARRPSVETHRTTTTTTSTSSREREDGHEALSVIRRLVDPTMFRPEVRHDNRTSSTAESANLGRSALLHRQQSSRTVAGLEEGPSLSSATPAAGAAEGDTMRMEADEAEDGGVEDSRMDHPASRDAQLHRHRNALTQLEQHFQTMQRNFLSFQRLCEEQLRYIAHDIRRSETRQQEHLSRLLHAKFPDMPRQQQWQQLQDMLAPPMDSRSRTRGAAGNEFSSAAAAAAPHAMSPPSAEDSQIVKLNVGGVRFHVARRTLTKFPGTLFDVLLAPELERTFLVDYDDQKHIFLDRDPDVFRELLRFFRCSNDTSFLVSLSADMQKRLREEAIYFGIDTLLAELQSCRGLWVQGLLETPQRGALPPSRCFATGVYYGRGVSFVFGGCTAADAFFDSLYRVEEVSTLSTDVDVAGSGGTLRCSPTSDNEHDSERSASPYSYWQQQQQPATRAAVGAAAADRVTETMYGGGGRLSPPTVSYHHSHTGPSHSVPPVTSRFVFSLVKSRGAAEEVPRARSGHTMVLIGPYLILLFGNDKAAHMHHVHAFHIPSETWSIVQQRGDHVEPRSGHSTTVMGDGSLYLIGGRQIFPVSLLFGDIIKGVFDGTAMTLTWSRVTPHVLPAKFPTSSAASPAAVSDPSSSVLAGMAATPSSPSELNQRRNEPPRTLNDERRETTASLESQRSVESMDCFVEKRAYHSAVAYHDLIVIHGGIVHDVYCADVCLFDTTRRTWKQLVRGSSDCPLYVPSPPRSGHIAVIHGDEMFAAGSYSEMNPSLQLVAFCLRTFRWRRVATASYGPCRRAAPTGMLLPHEGGSECPQLPRLFLFGGFDIATRKCFNDLFTITL